MDTCVSVRLDTDRTVTISCYHTIALPHVQSIFQNIKCQAAQRFGIINFLITTPTNPISVSNLNTSSFLLMLMYSPLLMLMYSSPLGFNIIFNVYIYIYYFLVLPCSIKQSIYHFQTY